MIAQVVPFALIALLVVVNTQSPSQVHVGYGGNSLEYVVSWVNMQTNGTKRSYVEYGYAANALNNVAEGVPYVSL